MWNSKDKCKLNIAKSAFTGFGKELKPIVVIKMTTMVKTQVIPRWTYCNSKEGGALPPFEYAAEEEVLLICQIIYLFMFLMHWPYFSYIKPILQVA
ncbi:MAG: hypothetical protein ACE5KT_11695 [Methanosarcinales archaeon]